MATLGSKLWLPPIRFPTGRESEPIGPPTPGYYLCICEFETTISLLFFLLVGSRMFSRLILILYWFAVPWNYCGSLNCLIFDDESTLCLSMTDAGAGILFPISPLSVVYLWFCLAPIMLLIFALLLWICIWFILGIIIRFCCYLLLFGAESIELYTPLPPPPTLNLSGLLSWEGEICSDLITWLICYRWGGLL